MTSLPQKKKSTDRSTQTERTTLGRFAFRARYERETVNAILDSAFLCHVGYVRDGVPFVTPTSFWREDDVLYWHGSAESKMLKSVSGGIPVCFTVSHVDGLVLSRVMSRHSFNYRSVVALGTAVAVTDPDEKMRGMQAFVDRMLPGRWRDGVQEVTPTEIERITIVKMDLNEASAKVRSGPPKDSEVLFERSKTWAGHVPFKLSIGQPVPDPNLKFDLPVPDYVRSLAERFDGNDLMDVPFGMPEFVLPAQAEDVKATVHKVEVLDTGAVFDAREDATLLSAALANGVDLPYGCAAGGCGACKVRLVMGRVNMLPYERAALTDAERDAGWILACCARPVEACAIVPRRNSAKHLLVNGARAQVVELKRLAEDIVGLTVRLDDGHLDFIPGQFALLRFQGQAEREYSIASQPGSPNLEFHIRIAPNGRVSRFVAEELAIGDPVDIKGPFGTAVYRKDDAPIVAIAGGSGLAPIKSIVDRLLKDRPDANLTVYFGARDEPNLYLIDYFEALAAKHPGMIFHPVLSMPSENTERRSGHLAAALRSDAPRLNGAIVYMAGPSIMVETCRAAALALGADPDMIFADAFLDADEKQTRLLSKTEPLAERSAS